jgi:hypothetical protein
MARLSGLNGWRRLWIVISVAGFFYAVGWGFLEGARQYRLNHDVISAFGNPRCNVVIQMPAGTKLSPEPRYDDPCWDLYLYRSIWADAQQTKDGYVDHMTSNRNEAIFYSVGAGFILWGIAVAILYGGGATVAWIVQGFRGRQ